MMSVEIIPFTLCLVLLFSGQTRVLYLFFDATSTSTCEVGPEMEGRFQESKRVKSFEKVASSSGDIRFYLCKELFQYASSDGVAEISETELSKLEFSDLDDLIKKVSKENPLYPSKVFPKIYVIEKGEGQTYLKYPVEWKYYIE
jgi:hypothetical protein